MTLEIIERISSKLKEPEWLLEKRKQAFNQFNKLTTDLELPVFNLEEEFITNKSNGYVIPFSEALKSYESILKKYLFTTLTEKNALIDFHKSFFNSGILIYIPKGTIVEKPIFLELYQTTKTSIEHILIVAEQDTKFKIIEQTSSKENARFRICVVEIIAKENSQVTYYAVQNTGVEVTNYVIKRAKISGNAIVNWLDCCLGSKFTKSSIINSLEGRGASANKLGLFFGNKEQVFEFDVQTIHIAPNTTCDMLTKGALQDKAKTTYNGLIKIMPEANASIGHQKSDTILLSEDAQINPAPKLEIQNDNVKCSHGATVGEINKDQIFYLMSRGLTESEAKKSIVKGFFEPLIKEIGNEVIEQLIERRLEAAI